MDQRQVELLRALLDGTALEEQIAEFAATLGTAQHEVGGLLLVGTPDDEPWHFAAHLTDEAQWAGRPELAPLLVRWQVPNGAPPHLAVDLQRIEAVRKGETLLVVAPTDAPDSLLERVSDARRGGALILAMDTGDDRLSGLAHEALEVPRVPDAPYLDLAQHLVSAASPTARRASVRSRLGRWLDRMQGAPLRPPGAD